MSAQLSTRLRCISLHQPWASLVALGVKTIETRSWPTKVRGRIGIAAAKTVVGFDSLPGDCEGTTEGGWRYGYIGDFQVGHCYRSSDEGRRGDTFMVRVDAPPGGAEAILADPPLGALVATANLVDCVPIVSWAPLDGPATWAAHMIPMDSRSETPRTILVRDARVGAEALRTHGPLPVEIDATDQLPYGDFTPGRWAYLLDDIRPVDPPLPCKGKQGFWTPTEEVMNALRQSDPDL